MDGFTKTDREEALRAIASMMGRCEKAQEKFAQGTSQHTLQKNRRKALFVASSLIAAELSGGGATDAFTKEELTKALAPIASLIRKSEKAREKLAQGTWQHTMLGDNLKALSIASPLLTKALRGMDAEKARGE